MDARSLLMDVRDTLWGDVPATTPLVLPRRSDARYEGVERWAIHAVGACFLLVCAYVLYVSAWFEDDGGCLALLWLLVQLALLGGIFYWVRAWCRSLDRPMPLPGLMSAWCAVCLVAL